MEIPKDAAVDSLAHQHSRDVGELGETEMRSSELKLNPLFDSETPPLEIVCNPPPLSIFITADIYSQNNLYSVFNVVQGIFSFVKG